MHTAADLNRFAVRWPRNFRLEALGRLKQVKPPRKKNPVNWVSFDKAWKDDFVWQLVAVGLFLFLEAKDDENEGGAGLLLV